MQTVVNFDFPTTPKSYVHRVGRTARGGASGSSLSLVVNDKDDDILADTIRVRKSKSIIISMRC